MTAGQRYKFHDAPGHMFPTTDCSQPRRRLNRAAAQPESPTVGDSQVDPQRTFTRDGWQEATAREKLAAMNQRNREYWSQR
jgi:hypothetical protein